MKKSLPWIISAVFALWVLGSLRMPPDKTWAIGEFGRLPVLFNGRMQPVDSLARNALLQLREKQTANLEPGKDWYAHPKIISATEWLLGLVAKPEEADAWPVFRIDNPDVKSLLGLPGEPDPKQNQDGKHYSWAQIKPKLGELRRESARAFKIEAASRQPYDQALIKLWDAQSLYSHLKNTLGPAAPGDLDENLKTYLGKVEAGRTAYLAQLDKMPYDGPALEWLAEQFQAPLIVPIEQIHPGDEWMSPVQSVMQSANSGAPVNFSLVAWNKISNAYRSGLAGEFNADVSAYQSQLGDKFGRELKKAGREQFFNFFEPFYKSMILFLCGFLLVLGYWFKPAQWDWMRRAAVGLVVVALVVHTSGLLFRMILEGRPPVTNLYSSAIFIGWGACILGLLLERFWRNSIGVMVSSIIGFLTLIIAHHLRLGGDTMEMMRAVLDTNFWLATHVVVVTLGYASTFVAGFLAIIYIVQGIFTRALTADMSRSLARMIYGIICFASLFSFVGTVLGGIWADQSWGRFWGWDPKENGALIIVLWNVLVLHARWGGLVRERGLANMAIFGNIVTSWSWFGVNMLGIGLHSYGFTDAAFRWLMLFVCSQLILIGLGLLPKSLWLSFRARATDKPVLPGGAKGKPVPAT
jgi:ABC-type transport system involved in cytochrome c biogenesis permease subunit